MRLDRFEATFGYAAITTAVMLRAAEYWATARKSGRQSASDSALDADVILAAQAVELALDADEETLIATTNARHLTLFTPARHWREISAF